MNVKDQELSQEAFSQLDEGIKKVLAEREEILLNTLDETASKMASKIKAKSLKLVEKREEELQERFIKKIKEIHEGHRNSLAQKDAEIDKLNENIDRYSKYVTENSNSLEDKIYSIEEKAEQYGEYVKEEAEKEIQLIKEKAEQYGEYVKEEAEKEIQLIKEKAEQYGEYVLAESTKTIDTYLEYVVEQFVQENQKRLIDTNEYNKMKDLFESVKRNFGYAITATEQNPYVDEIKEKLDESIQRFNQLNEDYVALKRNYERDKRRLISEDVCSRYDLAQTQKERALKIVDGLDYKNTDEYELSLQKIVEEVMQKPTSKKRDRVQTETYLAESSQELLAEQTITSPEMQKHIDACNFYARMTK